MYVAQYIDVTMLELLLTRRLCCHTSMQYFCSFLFCCLIIHQVGEHDFKSNSKGGIHRRK